MSYDLSFYRKENSQLTKADIAKFLNENLGLIDGGENQWFVENEETETYYSFDYNEPSDEDPIIDAEEYPDFINTNLTFNLNYFRPDYFGQEAFAFVDTLIDKLDLYVLNPQGSNRTEEIYKPEKLELYKNWSEINSRNCSYFFKEYKLLYLPLEKSDYVYEYRKQRHDLWQELGDSYYVSKFYVSTIPDGTTATLALLPFQTAVVVPKSDYYSVTRVRKKWFKTIEETGLISHDTFIKSLGHLFENYKFPESKILSLDKVSDAQRIYNEIQFDYDTNYCQQAEIQKLSNYLPSN